MIYEELELQYSPNKCCCSLLTVSVKDEIIAMGELVRDGLAAAPDDLTGEQRSDAQLLCHEALLLW